MKKRMFVLAAAAAMVFTGAVAQAATITASTASASGWFTSIATDTDGPATVGPFGPWQANNSALKVTTPNNAWIGGGNGNVASVAQFATTLGVLGFSDPASNAGYRGEWISTAANSQAGRQLTRYSKMLDFSPDVVLAGGGIAYNIGFSGDNNVVNISFSTGPANLSPPTALLGSPVAVILNEALPVNAPPQGNSFYRDFSGVAVLSSPVVTGPVSPIWITFTVYNETFQDSEGGTSPHGLSFAGVFRSLSAAEVIPLPGAVWGGLALMGLVAGNRMRRSV